MTLKQAWNRYSVLQAKAYKLLDQLNKSYLYAKNEKLYEKADILHSRARLIWINAWIKHFGKNSVVNWDWGSYSSF